MRLICPSCGTEYEVEDDAIPPEGRDVQCSNCQTVWFQTAAASGADPETKAVTAAGTGVPVPEAAASGAPEAAEEEEPGFAPPPPLPQREIDPAVLAILHAEAARETAARAAEKAVERARAESAPPAVPPVPEAPRVKAAVEKESPKAPAKMPTKAAAKVTVKAAVPKVSTAAKAETAGPAEPRPDPTETAKAATPRSKARPALPDVEAVKSSLAAREAPPLAARGEELAIAYESASRPGRGFGRGFVTALLLGALLWGAYAGAPRLAKAWPPAAPYLSAYVQKVGQWRQGLAVGLSHVAQSLRRGGAGL